MKKLLNLGLSLVLVLGLCSVQGVKAETDTDGSEIIKNDETGIPDPNLYSLILYNCDENGDGMLTVDEALNEVSIHDWFEGGYYNIENLKGIEYLRNLKILDLSDNKIKDITPLSKLKDLIQLDLSNNRITDISKLGTLTGLTSLSLGGNYISDITILSKLINLEGLDLRYNNISNITPLAEMNQLLYLDLDSNKISDITPLSNLHNLDNLCISDNKISDITALSGLFNLSGLLALSDNNISNINALDNMVNLESLMLEGNSIKDVTALGNLTNLEGLWLNNNQIDDVTPLAALLKLDRLYLNDNCIDDVSMLSTLKNISVLELANNRIKDITVIKNMPILSYLNMQNNRIRYLPDLSDYDNLGYAGIYFSGNKIFETELKKKMPKYFAEDQVWIDENKYTFEVFDLKATSFGKKSVQLMWEDSSPDTEGYIIYRKIGNGKFEYHSMVKDKSYIDTTASALEYNFYRVYPYYIEDGKRYIGECKDYDYAKGALKAVLNVKAIPDGKNKVKVKWDASKDADGYIIYRKIGNGKFEYRYMVKGTTFTDTTASKDEFNFYRIYPYYNENGKRILGKSSQYDYAKGILKAVTSLKAKALGKNKVQVTWNPSKDAEGYIIYRKIGNGRFEYRYMVKGNSYIDTTASNNEYNFYRIYPYYTENGKRILGDSNDYKYAKGLLK